MNCLNTNNTSFLPNFENATKDRHAGHGVMAVQSSLHVQHDQYSSLTKGAIMRAVLEVSLSKQLHREFNFH